MCTKVNVVNMGLFFILKFIACYLFSESFMNRIFTYMLGTETACVRAGRERTCVVVGDIPVC